MKKTEIAMIILIASLSVLVAYFIAKATPLGNAVNESVTIKTVEEITADVAEPNPAVFNEEAINPTVEVFIGGNAN